MGFKIFSGSESNPLAEKIAKSAGTQLGLLELKQFSDGEIWVKFGENVRGSDVFLIQPTNPPAENLMKLLIMLDAAKRASAKTITAVIPYFGYSRQDRKDQPRVAITAKLVANLITTAGADRVITMDLHASQIQGFFDIPVDHLYGSSLFFNRVEKLSSNFVVVSPDVGGIKMARAYARRLNASLVVIDKRRPKPNVAEIVNILGSVEGKDVLLVDDMVDTAGTLAAAIHALKARGAASIYCAISHPILSGPAIQRLVDSPLTKLLVSDTVQLPKEKYFDRIEVVSAADLFAEAIKRIHSHESISSLFDNDKS
ncbi:MAG: ribose-phosphate pyrophosphokinase [Ignavibacteriales bacterium]|nr:ribose-phosphate pyrophosphokinase [Ignavibacteriales bacterium]